MTIPELIEALQIIAKYEPDGEIAATHDTIYAGTYNPDQMTEEDRTRLDKLGWIEEYESWARNV